MKHIVLITVAAAFSIAASGALAKTVTSSQGNANDRSVVGVAGPAPAAKKSSADAAAQPSKKALRKSKIKAPPPLHDPN